MTGADVEVMAWCGHCGESFRLAELIEPAFTGRCPRCGRDLAPGYTPVASAAVHDLLAAIAGVEAAASRLRDCAPRLHVDARRLASGFSEALASPSG